MQLAAEESVLQMANPATLRDLEQFITSPSPFTASQLVGIPALYDVLHGQAGTEGGYSTCILEVAKWIYRRGSQVFRQLQASSDNIPVEGNAIPQSDWCKVGCIILRS